jgi:glycosyltransferase involved in cell wall biosynthesis
VLSDAPHVSQERICPALPGKLSVVVPAYNEAPEIEANLREMVATIDSFGLDYELIVVDDGSPDSTFASAVRAKIDYPDVVRVVRYDRNQGKGNAVICGARYARGDFIAFVDADMDLHPRQLPTLIAKMLDDDADVVIGSKWHPDSVIEYTPLRRTFSVGYYAMVRALFGLPVRDTQTGMKIFRAEVLHRVFPRILAKRFAFDVEVLANAHRLGYSIVEAPIEMTPQRQLNRVGFGAVFDVFKDTLAIYYRMHVLRYYDRPLPGPEAPAPEGEREIFVPGTGEIAAVRSASVDVTG